MRAMASVRGTLRRNPLATAVATWATSTAWVSRVRCDRREDEHPRLPLPAEGAGVEDAVSCRFEAGPYRVGLFWRAL